MAVDLRSERVRAAAYLLDGVRRGGELGDLLGCRFERRLHDLVLDRFIDDCRRRVLEAKGITRAPRGPVDGLELAELYHGPGVRIDLPDEVAFTVRPDKVETAPGRAGLQGALNGLLASMDAVADASLADSMHYLLQGNSERASATLDAIATGAVPPPRLSGLDTPVTGASVTHRLMVALPPAASPVPKWGSSPRSELEPVALGLGGEPAGRSREGPLRGAGRRDRRAGAGLARRHRRGPGLQPARRAVRDPGHLGAARPRPRAVAARSREAGGRARGRYRPRRSGRRRALLRGPLRARIGASLARRGVAAARRARPVPARRRARERRRPGRGRTRAWPGFEPAWRAPEEASSDSFQRRARPFPHRWARRAWPPFAPRCSSWPATGSRTPCRSTAMPRRAGRRSMRTPGPRSRRPRHDSTPTARSSRASRCCRCSPPTARQFERRPRARATSCSRMTPPRRWDGCAAWRTCATTQAALE